MKPIIFNTEMVKAILDGRKTQFRKAIDFCKIDDIYINENGKNVISIDDSVIKTITEEYLQSFINKNSKYKADDVLCVKETFGYRSDIETFGVTYKADWCIPNKLIDFVKPKKWKPSIHLKQKDARLFLKVINVRVERLQDITFGDIEKEGYPYEVLLHHRILKHKAISAENKHEEDILNWWINLWNSTAKDGYKWEDNPYVFVYEFERVKLGEVK